MRADIVSEALQKHRGNIENNSVQSFVQALRAAPDSCAEQFMTLRAKSKLITFFFSLVLGFFAIDRFYIGERKSAIVNVSVILSGAVLCLIPFIFFWTTGSMGLSGFLLYVGFITAIVGAALYLADVFALSKKVKDINYRYLAGFLHDATGEAKVAAEEAAKAVSVAVKQVEEPAVESSGETDVTAEEAQTV